MEAMLMINPATSLFELINFTDYKYINNCRFLWITSEFNFKLICLLPCTKYSCMITCEFVSKQTDSAL